MTSPEEQAEDPRLFAELAGLLLTGRDLSDLLDVIVSLGVSAVEGVDGASVSVVRDDGKRFETSNASSSTIVDIDQAQYQKAQGPCVEAIRTGNEVTVKLPTPRWPEFSERATEGGVLSVSSLPLSVGERTLGGLNLYSTTQTALSTEALRLSRALAAQAGVVLANAFALHTAEMANQRMQDALETRDIIGQAKGILMARERISAEQAFDILRRGSQRTNRKVRDIAADLVNGLDDPGPEKGE